jgi:hypothetical protein
MEQVRYSKWGLSDQSLPATVTLVVKCRRQCKFVPRFVCSHGMCSQIINWQRDVVATQSLAPQEVAKHRSVAEAGTCAHGLEKARGSLSEGTVKGPTPRSYSNFLLNGAR